MQERRLRLEIFLIVTIQSDEAHVEAIEQADEGAPADELPRCRGTWERLCI